MAVAEDTRAARLARFATLDGERGYLANLEDAGSYEWNEDGTIDPFGPDGPKRFALVEKQRTGGGYFLSDWESADAAAEYHDGQEGPEDWEVAALVDLDTGEELTADTTTRFARADAAAAEISDDRALDLVATMLRDPEWGVGMLEDIADLVRRTGRDLEGDGTPTWDRH